VNIVYLHGFGSSPRSQKAGALKRLLDCDDDHFVVPELDGGNFPQLTMDAIAERAIAAVQAATVRGPVLVIGSSLGGYTAAWLAAEGRLPGLCSLVLVAPAFGFTDRWRERLGDEGIAEWQRDGSRLFWHYGAEQELPLGVAFLDSCQRLPSIPPSASVDVSIVHGWDDESVAWQGSHAYSNAHPNVDLHLVEGDHSLSEARHEALIAWCVRKRWAKHAVAPSSVRQNS
jgi:uncharacterized protein